MTTTFASDAPPGELLHVESHLPLLVDLSGPTVPPQPGRYGRVVAAVDAVIVPTSRRGANLSLAQGRARAAQCPLIVLCSGPAVAAEVIGGLGPNGQFPVVVADVDDCRSGVLEGSHYGRLGLQLRTDAFASATGNFSDVSYKRNLGLLLARVMGWRSVLFLDDDVIGLDDQELTRAAGHLPAGPGPGAVSAVSWRFRSFADNSSVCHAHRQAGGRQEVFVGSAALVVAIDEETPFFPGVYNEDWLFHFPLLARRRVGLAGDLGQLPFDPYDPTARRAVLQEFGDTLAEGVFRLLHGIRAADPDWQGLLTPARRSAWWERIIDLRRKFIQDIQDRVGPDPTDVRRTLDEALQKNTELTADMFAGFVRCWVDDSRVWRAALTGIAPPGRRSLSELPRMLDHFGIWSRETVRVGRPSPRIRADHR
jgi:hypothetical protein